MPPLGDMGDHIASYRILAEAGRRRWRAIMRCIAAAVGNLGVEGLVLALHLSYGMGVEPAARLVVMAIPPLTVGA